MKTIDLLRKSAQEVAICSKAMEKALVEKNGIFMGYLQEWAPTSAECTLYQAGKLCEKYVSQNKDLEDIKLHHSSPFGVGGGKISNQQMENLQRAQQRQGAEELSEALLELFNAKDKYETFPFDNYSEVYEEYKRSVMNLVDSLFIRMGDIFKSSIVEFLDVCIENEEAFDFSESGLLFLNGLLNIRESFDKAFQVFEIYFNDIEKIKELIFGVCLDYYDNNIVGNSPREYTRTWKEEPVSSMRDGEKSLYKNWISGVAAGAVGSTAAFLANSPNDFNYGNLVSVAALGALGGFIVGRIIATIIVKRKEKKIYEKFERIHNENIREEERWAAEVEAYFDSKSDDLQYWKDNAKPFIEKVKTTLDLLNEYIEDKFSFMPAKYVFDDYAVATFYDYLRDKRVDNIAQAVNLYLSEQKLEEFRARQLENQREILNAQNALLEENQRKNALLRMQVEQQTEIQENLRDLAKETIKLSKIEEKKAQEITKLTEGVEDLKYEINRLED